MDSFANKMLIAQRQAESFLSRQVELQDPASLQQSFLLRNGHFVGVRWTAGDWRAEWTLDSTELVLTRQGEEPQRLALSFAPVTTQSSGTQRRAA